MQPDDAPSAFVAVVDEAGSLEEGASQAVVPWWSFSKTLVAVCALRLVERGDLGLDGLVGSSSYSLRQLLQHRSGLGDYGSLAEYHAAVGRGDPPWSRDELFARVPLDRPLFLPEQGWAYSNVGYLLVRMEIERVYGGGLGVALDDLVLRPLGLATARLALTPEDMSGTAFIGGHGYHPGWVFHGCVIGPVAEAALALHRLLGGPLLDAASMAAMLDRHPIGGPLPGRPWQTTGYGLGLMMGAMQHADMAQPLEVLGHSAGGPGSSGAVYGSWLGGGLRTAAAFVSGHDEAPAERLALRGLQAG